jgi:hypothetical protein
MKIIKAVTIVTAIFLLLSCRPGARKAFNKLKVLKGSWESSRNIKIYFTWKQDDNILTGKAYNLLNKDTLFLKFYKIFLKNDSLVLIYSEYEDLKKEKTYFLDKSFMGKYKFITKKDVYPYNIEFIIKDENGWDYTQTNSRGKKEIKFFFIRKYD